MMSIKNILKLYPGVPLKHKIFIVLRYLMVPWGKIIDYIGDSGRVLDIGAGHGLFLGILTIKKPKLECFGFELDERKSDLVKPELEKRGIKYIEARELSGLDSYFNYVTIADVLYCLSTAEQEKIINECYKVLKSGGLLIVKETSNKNKVKYLFSMLQEFLALKILKFTKGHNPNITNPEYYLSLFEQNGLKLVEHYPIDKFYPWPHYLFVLKK